MIGVELEGANVVIRNVAPDEGLSAPFNSWFTLFGQFFDHGLDLVNKGGNGTVFIPLMPDDPLYVQGGNTNFMVLTRATLAGPGADGVMGTSDDTDRPVNTTTPFVDQTRPTRHIPRTRYFYASTYSTQQAIRRHRQADRGRQWRHGDLGRCQGAGRGSSRHPAGRPNVGNVPLLATDPYGEFIRGPNGFPQIVTRPDWSKATRLPMVGSASSCRPTPF